MIRTLLAALAITLLLPAMLLAESAQSVNRSSEPIKIKSDHLHTDNTRKVATFTGSVVARQADVTIYGDKLVIYYSEKDDEISTAEVFGNVRIIQEDRRGLSDHAIYDARKGTIVLDGNPKVYQNNDTITGKIITYYLDSDTSEATSGPDERVDALIHPKGKRSDGNTIKP